MLSERDPAGAALGRPGRRGRGRVDRVLHQARRRGQAPRRRRPQGGHHRRRPPAPTSQSASASTTTSTTPTSTTSSRTPRARPTAWRRWPRCCSTPSASSGVHDDHPRLHQRPAHPRPAALRPAPRAVGGGQHHPDLDRGGQGDRAGHPRAERASWTASRCGCRCRTARSPTWSRVLGREVTRTRSTRRSGRPPTGRFAGILQYTVDPIVSTDIVGSLVQLHLRLQADHGERQPGQGRLLVRQRVGLLEPGRRPGLRRSRDAQPSATWTRPASGCSCGPT